SIAITIKAGYGDTLLPSDNTGSDYRSAIGQAEMTFKSGTTFIQFGYSRNFQPVVMFSYFGQDRVYARLRQQIAGKFTLALDASYDYLAYGDDVTGDQQDGRTDHFVSGGLSFDYHIIDWIEVGLAYDIQARISGWQQVTAPGGSQDVDYNKHMFTLHIGVDY
ncbi:MAG: hypothetical protein JRJ19_16135, partial [Deltaproteobacteria bacterium]|nr:hypothetical protein [Deltaproteobacteria bacterium]